MAEAEANVIGHLIDVEHRASELVSDAHIEADKRICQARTQADAAFKSAFEKIVAQEEEAFSKNEEAVRQSCTSEIAGYKAKISSTPKTVSAFNALLDKVLAN